jgi:phosphotransferase system enzyme I (PtsI)
MLKETSQTSTKHEFTIKGIPASPGIAFGPVLIYTEPILAPELRLILQNQIPQELERFRKAIETSKEYLTNVYEETIKNYGNEFGDLLHTQIMLLEDRIFLDEVEQLIKEKLYDAPYSTFIVFRNKKEHFLQLKDEYFRDRAFDIQNLKRLVLRNMLGKKLEIIVKENSIVAADNLTPADTIRLHHKKILGFCTNVGGKNSHTAIIARSLGVPAVVGTEFITNVCNPDDNLIVDGNDGIIIVNPTDSTTKYFHRKQNKFLVIEKDYLKKTKQPTNTADGHKRYVYANIELIEELKQVKASGAEGIGLYRTEGLFLDKSSLPSEENQVHEYTKIAETMKPHTVVIRTLDVGGDKLFSEFVGIPERNPFLGWRAIRFCLDHKEIFIPQLKAILRSNIYKNIKVLIPMVSSLEEIHQFKEVFAEAKQILIAEGKKFCDDIQIGMMVEIPSAAIMAESFSSEVDFFSIGTNDLIQYTIAVDRANEKISRLYNHFHPALLCLIKNVIDVGKKTNTPVTMCGEMAGDPIAVPLLLGMGLVYFSANHCVIPEIKDVIRHVSLKDCESLYSKIKKLTTSGEVKKNCEDFFSQKFSQKNLDLIKNNNLVPKG